MKALAVKQPGRGADQLLAAIAVVALIDCLGWTTARTLGLGGSIGRWGKRVVRRRVQLHGVEP